MSGGRVAVAGEVEDLGPWEHNLYFSLGRGFALLMGNAVGFAGAMRGRLRATRDSVNEMSLADFVAKLEDLAWWVVHDRTSAGFGGLGAGDPWLMRGRLSTVGGDRKEGDGCFPWEDAV